MLVSFCVPVVFLRFFCIAIAIVATGTVVKPAPSSTRWLNARADNVTPERAVDDLTMQSVNDVIGRALHHTTGTK